ncbi:MAG TPA: ATP-binding cassette domain-containing protein, partial [Opitutales bacterium]|nr:ATP-binding cassette domain-containing protein [Opitutales bacterium]
TIHFGDRIALIGRNGGGKSVLLKILAGLLESSEGRVKRPGDLAVGYVGQMLALAGLSGAQSFHASLTQALAAEPNLLILDEPTNHLDARNRKELLNFLKRYVGTLVIASHDEELLTQIPNRLWHIDGGAVHEFYDNYPDYKRECARQRQQAIDKRAELRDARKAAVLALEAERHRAAQSKRANENENDRRLLSMLKQKGAATHARMKGRLNKRLQAAEDNLDEVFVAKAVSPTFQMPARQSGRPIVCEVRNGSAGYAEHAIVQGVDLTLQAGERVAIVGNNASGKTTLLKAILADPSVTRCGSWQTVAPAHIGYLDQGYRTVADHQSVLDNLKSKVPHWTDREARAHLARFMFRSHEEVAKLGQHLSGGERAYLCLAQIAASSPELLILDEATNNIDLFFKCFLLRVLESYQGSLLIVSHDIQFLRA